MKEIKRGMLIINNVTNIKSDEKERAVKYILDIFT